MFEQIIASNEIKFNELEKKVFKFVSFFGCLIIKLLLESYDKKLMNNRDKKKYRHKGLRETTEKLNTRETIKNISNLLDIELEEIPHYDTINDVFEKLDINELRKIQKYMVTKLIRSKIFDNLFINQIK